MKLLATIGAFLFSGIVAATPINNVVIFGDSLSDNGNLYEFMNHQLPQSPPYFEGRFSNGPVWIERLIASYFPDNPAAHLKDYAYGGAGVSVDEDDDDVLFTLGREIKEFLAEQKNKIDENSLFVVWIGANNYLGVPNEVEQTLINVNTGITHGLQTLVEKGAKHILVLNLPDLGKTPAAREFDSIDVLTYFTNQHNDALFRTVDDLKQAYPDVNWMYFDMHHAFNDVLEHADDYGITNTTDTCSTSIVDELSRTSVLKMVANVKPRNRMNGCDGYLFFDLVHPTAFAHQIMADKAREVLDALGIEITDKSV
ncbi:GDSL family lysophospholipase PlaA [uncultured Legionella sp.]|uniref:GDSL family lysophospholipase PlaA n=1 Tax=uncultured Legionella sp. TaxID=210934 RepID=UPI002613D131|nr:SGNH/GDSL hydrolase family protein [uncultured Legionella sp.]